MKKMWISVIREDGQEIRFRTDGIYNIRLRTDNISLHLADIGFSGRLFFSVPTDRYKTAADGNPWDIEVVMREELEELRVNLQAVTEEGK